jgi:uncharacterized protein (TIGR03118 family)
MMTRKHLGRPAALTLSSLLLTLGAAHTAAAQGYVQTNLVTDNQAVTPAAITDPNLVNPWGIAVGGAFWISDNGTGKSSLYAGDVNGNPLAKIGLVVTVPGAGGTQGSPTGQIYNPTTDFTVTANGKTGPALFITAAEDGTLTGWNPSTGTSAALTATTTNAVYKGLAIGSSGANNYLYAANFHTGAINVFDKNYAPTTLSGTFTDPTAPAGFAPFNIQNLNNKLYVTYAKQDAAKHDDIGGTGNGFVDVFDTSGNMLQRLATGSGAGGTVDALNSPWGIAQAPTGFGAFSGDLLVGNFGSGRIDALDPTSGAFLGQLSSPSSSPLTIGGLWGLSFGNGKSAGDSSTLYFTAGANGEKDGLFGSLKANPVPEASEFTSWTLVVLALAVVIRRRRKA